MNIVDTARGKGKRAKEMVGEAEPCVYIHRIPLLRSLFETAHIKEILDEEWCNFNELKNVYGKRPMENKVIGSMPYSVRYVPRIVGR